MLAEFDFHIHSNLSSDNKNGPSIAQIAQRASTSGLQGVAITDHDIWFRPDEYPDLALAYDVLLIPGIEISTDSGHLLVLGFVEDHQFKTKSLRQILDQLASNDVFLIAAHPFDQNNEFDLNLLDRVNAIEVNGTRSPLINRQAMLEAELRDIPIIGSSDAHRIQDVGKVRTGIKIDEFSTLEVLQKLFEGDFTVLLS